MAKVSTLKEYARLNLLLCDWSAPVSVLEGVGGVFSTESLRAKGWERGGVQTLHQLAGKVLLLSSEQTGTRRVREWFGQSIGQGNAGAVVDALVEKLDIALPGFGALVDAHDRRKGIQRSRSVGAGLGLGLGGKGHAEVVARVQRIRRLTSKQRAANDAARRSHSLRKSESGAVRSKERHAATKAAAAAVAAGNGDVGGSDVIGGSNEELDAAMLEQEFLEGSWFAPLSVAIPGLSRAVAAKLRRSGLEFVHQLAGLFLTFKSEACMNEEEWSQMLSEYLDPLLRNIEEQPQARGDSSDAVAAAMGTQSVFDLFNEQFFNKQDKIFHETTAATIVNWVLHKLKRIPGFLTPLVDPKRKSRGNPSSNSPHNAEASSNSPLKAPQGQSGAHSARIPASQRPANGTDRRSSSMRTGRSVPAIDTTRIKHLVGDHHGAAQAKSGSGLAAGVVVNRLNAGKTPKASRALLLAAAANSPSSGASTGVGSAVDDGASGPSTPLAWLVQRKLAAANAALVSPASSRGPGSPETSGSAGVGDGKQHLKAVEVGQASPTKQIAGAPKRAAPARGPISRRAPRQVEVPPLEHEADKR